MGESGVRAPVTTTRMSPLSSTYEHRSVTPVSGPAYATTENPKPDAKNWAAWRALPTQSSRWSQPVKYEAGVAVDEVEGVAVIVMTAPPPERSDGLHPARSRTPAPRRASPWHLSRTAPRRSPAS